MAGAVNQSHKTRLSTMNAVAHPRHSSFSTVPIRIGPHGRAYTDNMLEFIFQLLAIYLFVATPCFAGWIANGGK
jgi:hypothetical protein